MKKPGYSYMLMLSLLVLCSWQPSLAGDTEVPDGTKNGSIDETRGDQYSHPASGELPDQVDAEHWYLSAAEQGDKSVWGKLGALYLKGGGGLEKDFGKARYWLQKAASTGDPHAQFNLGVIYAEALGTGYDWPRARYWLMAAARNGSVEASKYLKAHAPQQ